MSSICDTMTGLKDVSDNCTDDKNI